MPENFDLDLDQIMKDIESSSTETTGADIDNILEENGQAIDESIEDTIIETEPMDEDISSLMDEIENFSDESQEKVQEEGIEESNIPETSIKEDPDGIDIDELSNLMNDTETLDSEVIDKPDAPIKDEEIEDKIESPITDNIDTASEEIAGTTENSDIISEDIEQSVQDIGIEDTSIDDSEAPIEEAPEVLTVPEEIIEDIDLSDAEEFKASEDDTQEQVEEAIEDIQEIETKAEPDDNLELLEEETPETQLDDIGIDDSDDATIDIDMNDLMSDGIPGNATDDFSNQEENFIQEPQEDAIPSEDLNLDNIMEAVNKTPEPSEEVKESDEQPELDDIFSGIDGAEAEIIDEVQPEVTETAETKQEIEETATSDELSDFLSQFETEEEGGPTPKSETTPENIEEIEEIPEAELIEDIDEGIQDFGTESNVDIDSFFSEGESEEQAISEKEISEVASDIEDINEEDLVEVTETSSIEESPEEKPVDLSDEQVYAIQSYVKTLTPELRKEIRAIIMEDKLPVTGMNRLISLLLEEASPSSLSNFLKEQGIFIQKQKKKKKKKRKKTAVVRRKKTYSGVNPIEVFGNLSKILLPILVFASVAIIGTKMAYDKYMGQREFNKGLAFIRQGQYEMAEKHFSHGLDYIKKTATPYIDFGNTYLNYGEPQKAEKKYLDGLKKFPKNSKLFYGLYKTYITEKNYPQAENYIKKAIHIKNKNIDFLDALGKLYIHSARYDTAISYYNDKISKISGGKTLSMARIMQIFLIKDDKFMSYNLGSQYQTSTYDTSVSLGYKWYGAISEYANKLHQRNYKNSERYQDALTDLVKYYIRLIYEDKKNLIKEIFFSRNSNPVNRNPDLLKLDIRREFDKFKDKLNELLRYMLMAYPGNIEVHYLNGEVHLYEKRYRKAEYEGKMIKNLLKEAEGQVTLGLNTEKFYYKGDYLLGRVYYETGQFAKALQSFNNILRKKKNFADAYYYLGRINYDLVNQDKEYYSKEQENDLLFTAYNFFNKAYNYGKRDTDLLYNIGRISYLMNDYNKAKRMWSLTKDQLGSSRIITENLANCDFHLRWYRNAKTSYQILADDLQDFADNITIVQPDIPEHHKIFRDLSRIYNNLGASYQLTGNSEKALLYYWKAIEAASRINEENEMARVNVNRVFHTRKNNEEPIMPLLDDKEIPVEFK